MGEVYRAEDTSLGREVALKLLPPEVAADPQRLGLFKKEAKAVAALDHPNIVTIHSVEEADGMHFITMELVRGKTLDNVIPSGGVTLERFFELAISMAKAVSAAHERGIVHRDLKPANVMVTGAGVVKILDFGLAKKVGQRTHDANGDLATDTLPAGLVGTVPYMSPEHIGQQETDERSDIFSLGIILFEMATGQRPFQGETNVQVAGAIIRQSPPSVIKARPDLPADLSRIVNRCLQKNPKDRVQSARDLCHQLDDPAKGTERKSVAVLPFKSPKDQKHFADGLSDELINGFSQIQGVQVLARTSSFSFKNQNLDAVKIGERLRVAWVIEGEVQKSKDRLRVRARLVETETGVVEWSEEYEDRLLDDIFDVQDKITRSIIDQLGVGLLGKEEVLLEKRRGRRVKPSVYDDYLKARAAWADRFEGRLKDAMEGFEKVIKEEPGYAPAHSGLADCYT
ncbi:MAG: serine/threonine-protein kinase, partial [Thermoanaerobaculia bacterium]